MPVIEAPYFDRINGCSIFCVFYTSFPSRLIVLFRIGFAASLCSRASSRTSPFSGWLHFFRKSESMQPGNSSLTRWIMIVRATWCTWSLCWRRIQALGWRNSSTSPGCMDCRRVSNNRSNLSSIRKMKYSNVKITFAEICCRRIEEINTFARTRHIVLKSWAHGPGVSICVHRRYDSIDSGWRRHGRVVFQWICSCRNLFVPRLCDVCDVGGEEIEV